MDRRILGLLAFWTLAGSKPVLAAVPAPDIGLLQEQNRIKTESEAKIQNNILDPILGKGQAVPFVDVEMELKAESEESTRLGMGLAEKYREKLGNNSAGMQTIEVMPGIPKPKTISANGPPQKPESASAQQAQQAQGIHQERYAVKPVFKKLGVAVIHDDGVLRDKAQVDLVRSRIVDAMAQYDLQPDQVVFRPTKFKHIQIDWKDDLKRPEVYLPLLYALLFLLLLSFLFGPLWKFFREYVKALREKPAAEVNIESKIEQPDDTGKDEEDGRLLQEGKLDLTVQSKPDEPPPPPPLPVEDDEMKKFEPFSYITEENVKRLAYMFLLRKEEPWIVAVVTSYLKPELARLMIANLPVEMQSKVALEALTLRQVTREQVIAIDADIKENVDFVVGGMERLMRMLDEADTSTRNNILNYLKNEKPMIYEAVRRHVLVFDDIVGFPDREMQTIVRELKADSMARALHGASPEILNKFLSNMSAGAGSLLKESIEYITNISQAQVDEERVKIMDVVKALDKEGKISVRQAQDGSYDVVEGMQEELSAQERRQQRFAQSRPGAERPAAAPAYDPAQAQQYYEAALQYYQAGQTEASIPYFETALSLNPGIWEAHQYLGLLLYQQGRVEDAVAHYEKVLKLHPDPQIQQWLESLKAQAGIS